MACLQILRITLHKESWVGEENGSGKADPQELSLADAARANPRDLSSTFHRYELAAALVEDVEDSLLDSEASSKSTGPSKAFFSREVEEVWRSVGSEPDESGAQWWLPHGVLFYKPPMYLLIPSPPALSRALKVVSHSKKRR
jgi:hypothetical protein